MRSTFKMDGQDSAAFSAPPFQNGKPLDELPERRDMKLLIAPVACVEKSFTCVLFCSGGQRRSQDGGGEAAAPHQGDSDEAVQLGGRSLRGLLCGRFDTAAVLLQPAWGGGHGRAGGADSVELRALAVPGRPVLHLQVGCASEEWQHTLCLLLLGLGTT